MKRIINEAKKVLIRNKQKFSVAKSLSPINEKTKHLRRLCGQGKSNKLFSIHRKSLDIRELALENPLKIKKIF